MPAISRDQLQTMDRLVRATFFNLTSGFKSPVLIGTISSTQQTNLGLFSSLIHIGANPPLLGFILRPTTVPRHTYANIKATGMYTLNHVTHSILDQAHQASAKYASEVSEFDAVGLTPIFSASCKAPYVTESPLRMGLRLVEEHPIEANGTRLIVGEVTEIWIEEDLVQQDGWFDPSNLDLVAVAGLEGYFRVQFDKRLPYARP